MVLQEKPAPVNSGVVLPCQQFKNICTSTYTYNMLFYYSDQNTNAWKNNYPWDSWISVLLKAVIEAYRN